jgi:Flp pilus assembly protein TadD
MDVLERINPASACAALVAAANQHFAAGRLADAGALYEQAHALAPEDPEILHALGLVRWQTGALGEAEALIAAALAHAPAQASYHDHHGLALAALGRRS